MPCTGRAGKARRGRIARHPTESSVTKARGRPRAFAVFREPVFREPVFREPVFRLQIAACRCLPDVGCRVLFAACRPGKREGRAGRSRPPLVLRFVGGACRPCPGCHGAGRLHIPASCPGRADAVPCRARTWASCGQEWSGACRWRGCGPCAPCAGSA